MGANIGILSGRTESPIAVGDRIKSVLGPDGPSVVIDCAGFEATMQVSHPYLVVAVAGSAFICVQYNLNTSSCSAVSISLFAPARACFLAAISRQTLTPSPLNPQAAVRSCSAGGKVVLVGMGDELMKLDMTHACTHEIDLVGSFRYANTCEPFTVLGGSCTAMVQQCTIAVDA